MEKESKTWIGDWNEIAERHVFPHFRSLVLYHYYRRGMTIDELLEFINSTHPEVTRAMVVEKLRLEDFPLRTCDTKGDRHGRSKLDSRNWSSTPTKV